MKNINQLKKEIEECPYTPEASPEVIKKEPERHCSTCRENVLKLQTLQEVCEEIEKELNYYSMPLKDRLKLKVGFDSGEAGHKSVILIKLRNKLQGEEK